MKSRGNPMPAGPMLLLLSSLVLCALSIGDVRADATFTIINADSPGEGFRDPAPWTPTGGNPATTLGQARLNAFQYAADIWGRFLMSDVPIVVQAQMNSLDCDALSAVLGAAGATNFLANFAGAPRPATFYPMALANAITGQDQDPGSPDISAQFNSNLNGEQWCLGGRQWYYGFDASPPGNDIDFVTVVMHEICHGLGFLTLVDLASGAKPFWNGTYYDDCFMVHLNRAGASPADYPSMTNPQRVAASTSDPQLRWTGPAVTNVHPAVPTVAGLNGGYVRMHAPNPQVPGSSVAHFSTDVVPNEVMEPVFTEPTHDPRLALFLLEDLGWELDAATAVAFEQISASVSEGAVEIRWQVAADEPVLGFTVYRRGDDESQEIRLTADPLPPTVKWYVDTQVTPGKNYHYAVGAVKTGGVEVRSAQVSAAVSALPTELLPNRPNPFNPATELRYRLAGDGPVDLAVYDLTGRLIRRLVSTNQAAGSYAVSWNGRDTRGQAAPAGIYFGRLRTEDGERTQRLVLLK